MESVGFRNQNRYSQNFTNRYGSVPVAQRVQEVPNDESKTLVKAGLLQVCAVLLTKISGWCGQKLMQGKEFTSAENVNKIADEMLTSNNLKDKVDVKYIDGSNHSTYQPL